MEISVHSNSEIDYLKKSYFIFFVLGKSFEKKITKMQKILRKGTAVFLTN